MPLDSDHLEELAREAGAMPLGETQWIFSREDLERFAALLREPSKEIPPLPY